MYQLASGISVISFPVIIYSCWLILLNSILMLDDSGDVPMNLSTTIADSGSSHFLISTAILAIMDVLPQPDSPWSTLTRLLSFSSRDLFTKERKLSRP